VSQIRHVRNKIPFRLPQTSGRWYRGLPPINFYPVEFRNADPERDSIGLDHLIEAGETDSTGTILTFQTMDKLLSSLNFQH